MIGFLPYSKNNPVWLLVCWIFFLCPAWATPPQFEGEVTVTATGIETNTDEIPAPATVISREEITHSQQDTVADLLRRVPGFQVARTGNEGSVASLFTRGTESDHTLVLFDGVRLNSPYFGGFDFSQLATAGLERIEAVRGPYSALYGADAIGGVVNLVPARGVKETDLQLMVEGGQDDWQRLEGTLTYASGGFDLMVSAFDRGGNGALDNSEFDTRQFLLGGGWNWGNGHRVAVVAQDLDGSTGIPFSSPGSPTPRRRQSSRQQLIAVPSHFNLSPSWNLELNLSQVERDFSFEDPDDPFGFTMSNTLAYTSQARIASHHMLGSHGLTVGAEWREDKVSDVSSYGVNLENTLSEVASLFLQEVWAPATRLRIIAGVRWDDADVWGSEVSPRFNIGWHLNSNVELRAGFGEAFRQPSVGELYFPFSGNDQLKPEQSKSAEIGLVGRYANGDSWQLNVFNNDLEQLIDFDYSSYTFQNVAEAQIRGAELGGSISLQDDIELVSQVTYLRTEGKDGLPLLRRPKLSGSLTLTGSLWQKLNGDLTLLWVGRRDDVDPTTFSRLKAKGYVTANLALACQMWEKTELTLRIVNVGNEAYEEVLGYPAPGRRVLVGIRIGR
jgi:vitamin B12 transporter